jgi:cob(I)alamin adenosyltransferase
MDDIQRAAGIMLPHCDNNKMHIYLCALSNQLVRLGYNMQTTSEAKQKYLDEHVDMMKKICPDRWVTKTMSD